MSVTLDLRGRQVLLTGALGSLGLAQLERLAQAGAGLLLLDRPEKESEGRALAADLADRHRLSCGYVGLDLGELEQLDSAAQDLVARHGTVDVLINNAALIVNQPLLETSTASYEDQVRINSSAAFVLSRALAPAMIARGHGRIINFCSVTLNGNWTGYAPYVASKGALLGLTRALARELGPAGIRVNAISPGAVVSDAEARVFGDRLQEYDAWVRDHQCLKERIEPRHIADAVLFLASPASEMMTGALLEVTAGW